MPIIISRRARRGWSGLPGGDSDGCQGWSGLPGGDIDGCQGWSGGWSGLPGGDSDGCQGWSRGWSGLPSDGSADSQGWSGGWNGLPGGDSDGCQGLSGLPSGDIDIDGRREHKRPKLGAVRTRERKNTEVCAVPMQRQGSSDNAAAMLLNFHL